MASQQAVGGSAVTATSTNNKTGRIFGTKSTSIGSGLVSGLQAGNASVPRGNYPVDTSTINAALSGGTFGYLGNTRGVIKRVTTSLATVANTVLRSGGIKVKISVAKTLGVTTYQVAEAIRAGNFNVLTGGFSSPPDSQADSFGSRDDATLNSTIKWGELQFRTGSPTVSQNDYANRYLW